MILNLPHDDGIEALSRIDQRAGLGFVSASTAGEKQKGNNSKQREGESFHVWNCSWNG
jgi:hypothetical protein